MGEGDMVGNTANTALDRFWLSGFLDFEL